MKIRISREIEFIPEWNNNQEETDPIKAVLMDLSTAEREECIRMVIVAGGDVELKPDYQKLFKRGVTRIDNLSVEIDGKEQKITTPEDLLKAPGFYNLFMEIATKIISMTMEASDPN